MIPDLDDLLVGGGVMLLALGVWLAWGLVALVFFSGIAMILAGVLLAVRGDGRTRVDRTERG